MSLSLKGQLLLGSKEYSLAFTEEENINKQPADAGDYIRYE